ncbi:MAG TPA: cytochrome c [Phycisphaerales bacterium]|nr:cytochrome c [Phycisphaerales bacterium]
MNTLQRIAILSFAGLGLAACRGENKSTHAVQESSTARAAGIDRTVQPPAVGGTAPVDYAGLHNVVAYHEGYYSGSVPEGDEGFETLRAMGIKTIISVDGAAPDLAMARSHGMRYIHLPIGYNGFDEKRKLELTRATRDALAQGPVYIHCHHGKHRSAGAAGAVAVSLGWSTPEQMVERMKVSGTAPGYKGLYACTSGASPVSSEMLDAVSANFPESTPPHGFVKAMVEIDEVHERLKLVEKAGWKSPANQPDLVPAAEAGQMSDLLRHLKDDKVTTDAGGDFAKIMADSERYAQALEDMLAAGEQDTAKLSGQFKLLAASCKDCHVRFRD